MNIPASVEPLIKEHMDSGRYGSVEDLLQIALTHLRDDWNDDVETLRALIQEGLDEIDRGETIPAEQVFAELRARHASSNNNPLA